MIEIFIERVCLITDTIDINKEINVFNALLFYCLNYARVGFCFSTNKKAFINY